MGILRCLAVLAFMNLAHSCANAQSPTDLSAEAKKPQTPKKPLPYDEQDIDFPTKSAAVTAITISGTLTKPRGTDKCPAIILVSCGGPQSRDGAVAPNHQPYLVLADHLTRRGFIVLRCDKRGVVRSTGNFKTATTADLASDVDAALEFLKTRKDIDQKRIGIVGHCEGALIATIVAARPNDIAFVVLMSCPAHLGEVFYLSQWERFHRDIGLTKPVVSRRQALMKAVMNEIRERRPTNDVATRIGNLFAAEALQARDPSLDPWLDFCLSDWFKYYIAYDPLPTISKLTCPVLAIQGEKDMVVDADESIKSITKALIESESRDVTIKLVASVNHMFQTCKSGAMAEYGQLEETIAPAVLRLISDWIAQRTASVTPNIADEFE